MFSPENYIRWTDMRWELEDWASRILLANYLEAKGENTTVAFELNTKAEQTLTAYRMQDLREKNNTQDTAAFGRLTLHEQKNFHEEYYFSMSIIINQLMSDVLLEFDTLICSPTGLIMRAPEPLIVHADRLDYCTLYYPLREMVEFQNYYELFDAGNFVGNDISDRFCFIDANWGTIVQKNSSVKHFELASGIGESKSLEIDTFLKHGVTPFIGWAVVWNNANFPKTMMEVVQNLGALSPSWTMPDEAPTELKNILTRKKRGPKPSGAKDEYYRRYPDGKPTNLSFDAIAAELAEAGFIISSRQIQNYERERKIS